MLPTYKKAKLEMAGRLVYPNLITEEFTYNKIFIFSLSLTLSLTLTLSHTHKHTHTQGRFRLFGFCNKPNAMCGLWIIT